MRIVAFPLKSGEKVLVYSERGEIVLQVRRLVHGKDDPKAASFKSSVLLSGEEAARVAAELLKVASLAAAPGHG